MADLLYSSRKPARAEGRPEVVVDLPRPLIIFDGDCGFCRHWISCWCLHTQDRIDYAPYQQVADRFPEISRAESMDAVQLIEPGGARFSGAQAVFRSLYYTPRWNWAWSIYAYVPLVDPVMNAGYRFIASHRKSATCPRHSA